VATKAETGGTTPRADDPSGSLALLVAGFDELLARAHALSQDAEELLLRLLGDTVVPAALPSSSFRSPERRRWRRE
jgi:hypothetical protein